MKILILGGYGTFGGRLAELLAGDARLALLIAGRSRQSAEAFCRKLEARARALPLAFDRNGDLDAQLAAAAPEIVVDASGPFQAYGDAPHRVARACISRGIGYLDFADGREFVAGVSALDAEARARGVYVLSGVSSFPVLTAAVVRRLLRPGDTLDAVTAGVAPSPYAGVGLNVIRAVAGYAGTRVAIRRDGRNQAAHALIDSRRFAIAPPGYTPLDRRRFSLVDVPDLYVLPALWPEMRSAWMGAGPVPAVLHRGLSILAWLVRLRLVRSLAPLAKLFHFAINRLRWGEDRGGMFVAITGRSASGERIARAWHMIAEGRDGPLIPSMACAAVIRRVLEGNAPAPGARPAVSDLELEDYQPWLAARRIAAGFRDDAAETAVAEGAGTLFRRILGDAWDRLPEPVRALHARDEAQSWHGNATVARGRGLAARLAAALFRFPRAGASVPVRIDIRPRRSGLIWRRRFGDRSASGRSFASRLDAGRGRFDRLLAERFGPFAFGIALVLDGEVLRFVVRRWSVFGIPLPACWAPGGATREFDDGGRFGFDVEISHRLLGLIVRYKGWLVPAPTDPAEAKP